MRFKFWDFKLVIQDSMWVIIGQLATAVSSIVSIKLLVNALSKHDFGVYSVALTLGGFVSLVLFSPLNQSVLRFYANARKSNRLDEFIQVLLPDVKSIILLAISILVIVSIGLVFFLKEYRITVLLVICNGLFVGFTKFFEQMLNSKREQFSLSLGQAFYAALKLILFYIVIFTGYKTLNNFLAASAMSGLLSVYIYWKLNPEFVLKKGYIEITESGLLLKQQFKEYRNQFRTISLVSWITSSSDKWIVSFFLSVEGAGIYSALKSIFYNLSLFAFRILTRILSPIVFSSDKRQLKSKKISVIRFVVFVILIVSPLVFFTTHKIISFTLNEDYLDKASMAFVLFFTSCVFGVSQVYTIFLQKDLKAKQIKYVELMSIFISTILLIIGANISLNYVALALLCSTIIKVLIIYIYDVNTESVSFSKTKS